MFCAGPNQILGCLAGQWLPGSEGYQGADGSWPDPDGVGALKPANLHQGNQHLSLSSRRTSYLGTVGHDCLGFANFMSVVMVSIY
jgi:hypothetical protein